jgi:hypothetical protein
VFIVEIFLPLHDNNGVAFAPELFVAVRAELAQRFGGVTAFMRSPAVGIWQDDAGRPRRDEIVVFEVMAETLDREWWRSYRRQLEVTFRQDEVVIRGTESMRI